MASPGTESERSNIQGITSIQVPEIMESHTSTSLPPSVSRFQLQRQSTPRNSEVLTVPSFSEYVLNLLGSGSVMFSYHPKFLNECSHHICGPKKTMQNLAFVTV